MFKPKTTILAVWKIVAGSGFEPLTSGLHRTTSGVV